MKLEHPNQTFKKTAIEGHKSLLSECPWLLRPIEEMEKDFSNYLLRLEKNRLGQDLKYGHVTESEFWIIDSGIFCGRISLRHHLTPSLKKFGGHIGYEVIPSKRRQGYASKALLSILKEARAIGLEKVLLTCNDNNIGSIKTIERAGGELSKKVQNEGILVQTRIYWIMLN